jgi:uncharacterized protein (TIGR03435 family)
VNNARLPLLGLVFACILLTGHVLGGQVFIATQAPPPPGATSPLIPAPPPPMDIPPDQLPRFEVASVKKFEGRVTSTALRTPGGGRITVLNLPLRTVIMQAFGGLRDYQLSGGPGWLTTDRFIINAKAGSNAPRDQVLLMLRAVLVDRFQMKYRVEKKEMQAYVLTTAEAEWKPTAKMKPVDCSQRGAKPPTGPGPIRPEQMPCGASLLSSGSSGGLRMPGATMATFVSLLSSLGGLGMVHDRTGLTGTYNIELDMSATSLIRGLSSSLALSNPSSPNLLPEVGDGRSINQAVRDLGLKLDRQKEMVDVLVIESVSQPDED